MYGALFRPFFGKISPMPVLPETDCCIAPFAALAAIHLTGGFQTQDETRMMNLKLGTPDMSVDEPEAMPR